MTRPHPAKNNILTSRLLLFLLFLFVANPSLAGNDFSEIISEIERSYHNVTSISGKFKQVMPLEGMGITREANGSFYIVKPGKSRWEYLEPIKQVFIVDGDNLYFKKEKDKSFRQSKVSGQLVGIYNILLGGEGKLPELFEFFRVKIDGKEYAEIELVPLGILRNDIKRIVLTWNRKSKLVDELTIFSLTGTSNTLSFEDVRVNQSVPSVLFTTQ